MTALVPGPIRAADSLAPLRATLDAMFDADDVPGLAPGLVVHDDGQWLPASRLVDGSRLHDLLDAARREWQASPHAAATLAWKVYSYWLSLPVVLSWASARRVPMLRPGDVLVRLGRGQALVEIGLRPSVNVAVLPTDKLLRQGRSSQLHVVDDEAGLLTGMRSSLLDSHLTPLANAIRTETKVGLRALRGSVSSGIAYGVLRAAHLLPDSSVHDIRTLLTALGVEDLVELVPGDTGEVMVRRKTCCLAFTLPRPKICSGCCIRARSGTND